MSCTKPTSDPRAVPAPLPPAGAGRAKAPGRVHTTGSTPSPHPSRRAGNRSRWPLAFAVLLLVGVASPAAADDAAFQQFRFAHALLQRGDDELAAEAFDDYLGSYPTGEHRGDAAYYRALLYRRADDPKAARQLLDAAPAPALVAAYAAKQLHARVLADLGEFDKAVAALEQIDPARLDDRAAAGVLHQRGVTYRAAGNLPAAEAALAAAAKPQTPLRPWARLDLAKVQALRDRPEEALKTLALVLNDAGEGGGDAAAEAARLSGDLSYRLKRYDDALGHYQRVLARHQSSRHFGPAVIGTLWALAAQGKHGQVIKTYNAYAEVLRPQYQPTAKYIAGSAWVALGEHEKAAGLLETLANSEQGIPLREQALYKLARSRYELGQYDAMRAAADRLLRLYPDTDLRLEVTFLEVAADAAAGDVNAAALRLGELIDEGPSYRYYRQALLRRADLFETHDQPEAAVKDYTAYAEAVAGDDRLTDTQAGRLREVRFKLVDLHTQLGDHAAAAAVAGDLLGADGLGPVEKQEAMYRRAVALIKAGEPEAALQQLQTLAEQTRGLGKYDAQVGYYRGLLMSVAGDEASAREAAKLLDAAAGEEKLTRPQRANALRLLALHQRETGDEGAAVASLRRLEKLAGREALADDERLFLGRRSLAAGQPKEAVDYLAALVPADDAAEVSDAELEALFLTARGRRALDQHDAAIDGYRHVIAIGRGYDETAQLELALTRRDKGQFNQALADLQPLISSESPTVRARSLYESALIYKRVGQEKLWADDAAGAAEPFKEAERLLKRMLLLYTGESNRPLRERGWVDLYEIAAEAGNAEAARDALGELIERYPDSAYADYAKALQMIAGLRDGDAKPALQKLRQETGDGWLKDRIAATLQQLER